MHQTRFPRRTRGFTLIELLVVIAIIGVLAGLITPYLSGAQVRTAKAEALAMVTQLDLALDSYLGDHGYLPGRAAPADPETNVIAQVVAALRGTYLPMRDQILGISENGEVREPTETELEDLTGTHLVLIDPWGTPYVARENRSRELKRPWMRCPEFIDVYSCGPNLRNDTADPIPGGENDDIGNW